MARISALLLCLLLTPALQAQDVKPNEQIDYDASLRSAAEVKGLREARRISEEDFIRMAREPGTVVLDARSERLFRQRHIVGAVNLSFPEFTKDTLAQVIPTPATRVLIYCNNNFWGAPSSMPVKAVGSALNPSTFVSLHTYGYRNVYELGPVVDVANTRLAFVGTEMSAQQAGGLLRANGEDASVDQSRPPTLH